MSYLYQELDNHYDDMNEYREKSEYIDDCRLKLNNQLKRTLLFHGISLNMLDTFIKMFEFSYFEGNKDAIELANKLNIRKIHLVSHRDEDFVRDMVEKEIYENMEA